MSCCSAPISRTGRILLAFLCLLPAILYTAAALQHMPRGSSPPHRWLLAAAWWVFAAVYVRRLWLFRPAKPSCRPDPALSIAPHEAKDEPDPSNPAR